MSQINLREVMVDSYFGRPPKLEGKFPLVNDEGVITTSRKRRQSHKVLESILQKMLSNGLFMEAVGTGLKIGRTCKETNDVESLCVLHNFSDKGFEIYVLKRDANTLPKIEYKADGMPIRGANSKSSRVFVLYEGNEETSKDVANFISSLPGRFENGRITTFNKKTEKMVKKHKVEQKEDIKATVLVEQPKIVKIVKPAILKKDETVIKFKIEKGANISLRQKKVKKNEKVATA